MIEWQPIKTAPKTGEPIVGARWVKDRNSAPIPVFVCLRWETTAYTDGTTSAGWWCEELGVEWRPTHWMPYPPKPGRREAGA